MREIIIPVKNRPGALAEVTQALADAEVNIEEIDAESIEKKGVIIITVDRYDTALQVLNRAGFQAITEDAIVLKLANEPGALAQIARRLQEAQINIHSLRIAQRVGPRSLVTLVTDNQARAGELLAEFRISL
ncbi:MAG: ACT domain-containing protein [Verrucomicrobiales bacterium]|nr:ACT domain-containing protein [Verrucomicrobiales bacterium]